VRAESPPGGFRASERGRWQADGEAEQMA